jgi:hypothetical protein
MGSEKQSGAHTSNLADMMLTQSEWTDVPFASQGQMTVTAMYFAGFGGKRGKVDGYIILQGDTSSLAGHGIFESR